MNLWVPGKLQPMACLVVLRLSSFLLTWEPVKECRISGPAPHLQNKGLCILMRSAGDGMHFTVWEILVSRTELPSRYTRRCWWVGMSYRYALQVLLSPQGHQKDSGEAGAPLPRPAMPLQRAALPPTSARLTEGSLSTCRGEVNALRTKILMSI